ncbi:hypothetical protein [Bacteroides faecichinchillae]|uniref:hypothetical protein n=1 Tax=Bacteroides faecichinchillae TaxID=871325 RepID=UPI00053AB6AB|nr:hypothetical protein [Bacteroides faecichinchillae]
MWCIRTTVGSGSCQRQLQCRKPSAIGKPDKLTDGSDPVVAAFCRLFFSALAEVIENAAVSFWAFGYFDAQNSLNLRSLSIVRLLSLPDTSIWDW